MLCPPSDCQATGCGGHLVIEKDLPACGIDTAAAVGTIYRLPFVVYDREGLSAVVDRVIVIASPCSDQAPNLCSDGECHSVDCETVEAVSSIPGLAAEESLSVPLLVLLPTVDTNFTAVYDKVLSGSSSDASKNRTLFLAYGSPAPLSLLPCPSAFSLSSISPDCAAAAVQVIASNFSLVDITGQVSVTGVTTHVSMR